MVKYCSAYGCYEKFVTGGPVTFHSFPKDEFRRRQWVIKLRRKDFRVSDATKICSKHFADSCFETEKTGGTWLKKDALPTIFNFDHVPTNGTKRMTRNPTVVKLSVPSTSTKANEDVAPPVKLKKIRYVNNYGISKFYEYVAPPTITKNESEKKKNQLKKSKGSLPKNSPDVKKRTKKAQKKRDPKAAAKIKKLIVDPGDTGNALQSSSGGSLFDPNIVIKQEIIETEDPCDVLQVLRADNKPKLIKPNPSSTTNSSDKSS